MEDEVKEFYEVCFNPDCRMSSQSFGTMMGNTPEHMHSVLYLFF